MDKIYNKNAREKALLEEAYTGVYKESAVDVELDEAILNRDLQLIFQAILECNFVRYLIFQTNH